MTRIFLTLLVFLIAGRCHAQLVIVDPYRFAAATGNNLLTDLEAMWRFEETSGNPQDSSGNARHLTHYGTSDSVTGILGNARYHDATENDDYFGIASAAWNTFGSGDFTIAFWYKSDGLAGVIEDQVLIAKADLNDGISWAIGVDYGAYPNSYSMGWWRSTTGAIGDYGNLLACDFNETIVGGTAWYCVVMTRSGTTWTLRLGKEGEGAWDVTDAATETLTLYDNSAIPVTIGCYLASGAIEVTQDTYGSIDELVIASRAWDECEALKFFNAGVGRAFTTYDANPCL